MRTFVGLLFVLGSLKMVVKGCKKVFASMYPLCIEMGCMSPWFGSNCWGLAADSI